MTSSFHEREELFARARLLREMFLCRIELHLTSFLRRSEQRAVAAAAARAEYSMRSSTWAHLVAVAASARDVLRAAWVESVRPSQFFLFSTKSTDHVPFLWALPKSDLKCRRVPDPPRKTDRPGHLFEIRLTNQSRFVREGAVVRPEMTRGSD